FMRVGCCNGLEHKEVGGGGAPRGVERGESGGGGRAPPLNGSVTMTTCERRLLQAVGERLEQARARRVAQLPKRLRFNLADALARHVEVLADLFERVLLAVRAEAVAEFDDDLLA